MKTILIIVLVTMACVAGFTAIGKLTDAGLSSTSTKTSTSESSLTITVSGNVNKPGTYKLSVGSTVVDLLYACGGTTTNADELAFNTSHVLKNKEEIYISPLYDNSSTCANMPIVKVCLNSASAEELNAIAGFTKSASSAVVSYRSSSTFETLEQVMDVPGCGKATYMSVRDKLTLRSAE
ncbi:MAG: SLBB domain-containing protein [Candidatus Enteromonas sp.]|nr:SLBB domain-containing protein [Candidatus Enteromonas sp.]